jgi:putative nucleotidyltransferase with HDIG domain
MKDKSKVLPHYLKPEELRVGIFVELDLAWFKHNFALSSFKIHSESQLREVLALKLTRYRYDPERSDAPVEQPSLKTAESVPVEPMIIDDPVLQRELQRKIFLAQREIKIIAVEKAFTHATSVMKNLNRNLLSKPNETLGQMGTFVGEMVSNFLEGLEITLHVMDEKVGGEDVYYHSLNVTILAMILAKELGFSSEMAHELGIGAMIHDIGLTKIPERVSNKDVSECTIAERNWRATHVALGIEIGRDAGVSTEALAIIAQHHELADGSGYPNGLKEAEMTPAARLVSLVNYYDNLCNPNDISKAVTPHEALSLMFAQRRSKFEARSLALLIHKLGVYPPGSIVQLSNEMVASVISVNPKRSLRPCVMVYDPKVSKEKAIVLDLELETGISISKAIRPTALPPKVLAYLCPRKRVTYFFDILEGHK